MNRVINFSPGPAALPLEVMKKAQDEFINWQGSGVGVVEMSHRGVHFTKIFNKTKENLSKILNLPNNYKILFVSGGATAQTSAIPLNFCKNIEENADYIETGAWSTKAINEGKKFCSVNVAATSKDDKFTHIPNQKDWKLSEKSAYVHICSNETIHGTQFQQFPENLPSPLICDMSSDFLSKNIDVTKFDVIYAGAQKNAGIAGITFIIVKEEFLEKEKERQIPSALDYQFKNKNDSLDNTPSTFSIYMSNLVFEWILEKGGLDEIEKINSKKAETIYKIIDDSNGFYNCSVVPEFRSKINIVMRIKNGDENLEKKFLEETNSQGMVELKGHRSVGGIRISLYNAVSQEDTETLGNFMKKFEKEN